MMIARHIINEKEDTQAALKIVADSEHLSIEDILPILPDITQIGEFKEQIVEALEKYNQSIQHLKEEMKEYTQSADHIRQDIEKLKHRSRTVTANAKCDLTGRPVLNQQFLVFPCGHVFL